MYLVYVYLTDTVASLSLIAGVAATVGIVFGIAVIVIVFYLRRYMNIGTF